jgi:hypothetical protein
MSKLSKSSRSATVSIPENFQASTKSASPAVKNSSISSLYVPNIIKQHSLPSSLDKNVKLQEEDLTHVERDIDKDLIKYGYICDQIIKITHIDNPPQLFAKSCNQNGDFCYIEMDDINASHYYNHHVTVQGGNAFTIEKSIKVSAAECINSAVCGVVLECSDDVCMLKNEKSGTISEVSFSVKTGNAEVVSKDGVNIMLPIVLYTEIVNDNENVIVRVAEATAILQSKQFEQSQVSMTELNVNMFELVSSMNKFNEMFLTVQKERFYEKKIISERISKQLSADNIPGLIGLIRKKNILNYTLAKFSNLVDNINFSVKKINEDIDINYCHLLHESTTMLDHTILNKNGKNREVFNANSWRKTANSVDFINDFFKNNPHNNLSSLQFKEYIKCMKDSDDVLINKLKKYL